MYKPICAPAEEEHTMLLETIGVFIEFIKYTFLICALNFFAVTMPMHG